MNVAFLSCPPHGGGFLAFIPLMEGVQGEGISDCSGSNPYNNVTVLPTHLYVCRRSGYEFRQ